MASSEADITRQLRELLARTYALEPEKIGTLAPGDALFGGGLGLDSLDSMPLVIALEDQFGVTLHNDAATRKAFASVDSLAKYLCGLLS